MIGFWTAVVSSIMTLVGVIITCALTGKSTRDEVSHKLEIAQAVTDTKIEELTREVHYHNEFARRVPVVEEKIRAIHDRVSDLEER